MSMNKILLSDSPGIESLQKCSIQLADDLLLKKSGTAAIIKKAVTLLEIFKYQINKLQRIGYCDHELAFFCFKVSQHLIKSCQRFSERKYGLLIDELSMTLEALTSAMSQIERCFDKAHFNLEGRLARLTFAATNPSNSTYERNFGDYITPSDLNSYLRSSSKLILLLDFRSQKEYVYSHINFRNIVNIEPKLVLHLFKQIESPSDQDLEKLMEESSSREEVSLFRRRHDFDLVVMYDLRYGVFSDNKYESLLPLLTGSDSSFIPENPFRRLIELLVFRNQFLSSKLKNFPLFLNGGLQRWFRTYGEAALTREMLESFDDLPIGGGHISLSGEPRLRYLRTFQDYLLSGSDNAAQPNKSTNELNAFETRLKITESENVTASQRNLTPVVLNPSKSHSATGVTRAKVSYVSSLFSTGLVNLGNTCYMNCILQCLSASLDLLAFFNPESSELSGCDRDGYKDHINLNNSLGLHGVITSTFADLLQEMLRKKGKYLAPTKFKSVVGSFSPGKQFATSEQQDCIEFLNFLLDSLHEDLNQRLAQTKEERLDIMELSGEQEQVRESLPLRLASTIEWERYLKLNFSIIVDLFQGQYVSQLKCLDCQTTSCSYNSFSTLSLPIPEKICETTRLILLFECLDMFVETELLDEDNKWHCPSCQKFSKLTKKLVISRLPNILIIHLKRFRTHKGHFRKLEIFVDYPVNDALDLTNYWPHVGTYINSSSTGSLSESREIELLSKFPDRLQNPPFRYLLFGVVNHFGNLTTGHYTSFVKKSRDPSDWSYFDDSKVTHMCQESQVLNQNAYCLFYNRL